MKIKLDTAAKVKEFAKKVQESYQKLLTGTDYKEWRKEQEELEEAMMKAQHDLPKGLCVGKLCRFGVADGYAMYLVTKVGKRISRVEHLPFGDAYTFMGVDFDGYIMTACLNPFEVTESKRFANRF